MFGFIEKVLVVAMSFFSCSVFNVNSLKYVSMNNQEGKIRLDVISINSNGPLFYPYSNLVRKCNVVVIISMIHTQNGVFLMLLKA